MASVECMPDWPEKEEDAGFVGDALAALFEAHPEHASQYARDQHFDNMLWVCQRWLEILPLANSQRQWFIAQPDMADAKQFITLLLSEEN